MTCFEKIMAIFNLVAIVGIPILAVIIGQYLQNRAEKRKDKMQIFRTLMTSRIYGWTRKQRPCSQSYWCSVCKR